MGEFDGRRYTGQFTQDARVRYREMLYKCLTTHSIDPRQSDWNPADAPTLWARISDPAEEWPGWVQPTDATNAYPIGSKVTHNGRRWISVADANVWEPGIYGWEEVV